MLQPGDKVDRYEIRALAGSGGFGEVYRAKDTTLHRDVALKTIPAGEGEPSDQKLRFLQEARAASSLNHPNIITVFDIGQDRGVDFIAMEFVSGKTLDRIIAGSGIPPRDATRWAIQIASALEAAHNAGVIHRDLKPTNVMINDAGVVKVLDFGLAKWNEPAPFDAEITATAIAALTIEGSVIGTVCYMSPEQAESRQIDARSDIFSFGAVLYEMVTGQRAFPGNSALSTMAAILRDNPVPPSRLTPTVTVELERFIQRCLEKDRDRRFQSMGEVRRALEQFGSNAPVSTGLSSALLTPLPCAASIAVLPFANLSADKENEYFSDGLAEELINGLAKVKGLRVTARTSAFAFRDKAQDVRAIAKALNVETVLEGSVRKSGNRVRITAQLIKALDGYHLWSERYDRELNDIFAIQDEISQAIVDALCEHLGLNMAQPKAKRHTPNIEAYNALLLGRYHRFRFTPESWQLSRRALERAVELDPDYAEAHASLAAMCISEWALDIVAPGPSMDAARASVHRALELDSSLAEAHAILGTIRGAYEYKWQAAEQDFARALQLNAESTDVMLLYSYWHLRCRGRFHDARMYYRRILERDPVSAFALHIMAESYFFEGKYQDAIRYTQKTLEVDPTYWPPITITASCYGALGDRENAMKWVTKSLAAASYDPTVRCIGAAVQAMVGDPEPAHEIIAQLETKQGLSKLLPMLTTLYDAVGDGESSFRSAEGMIENRSARVFWIRVPSMRKLRTHPRFPELLARMNLDR